MNRFPRRAAPALCLECEGEVETITPDDAAILTHLSTRAIYRGAAEAGLIHYAEMTGFLADRPYSVVELAKEGEVARFPALLSGARARG